MSTSKGFDFLAPVYDRMARLVFGRAIVDSQTDFLNKIPAGAKILILGGGTGWLLEKIDEQKKSCTIWYVESSSGMMKKSQARSTQDKIYFIQGTEDDTPKGLVFDVIITNFYLDLFSDERLDQIISRISSQAQTPCIWLVTDFKKGSWWHRTLLTGMYAFFKLTCGIESSALPDWSGKLQRCNWMEIEAKLRFGTFIKSSAWTQRRLQS